VPNSGYQYKYNGKEIGSKTARKDLLKAINHKDVVSVKDNPGGKSRVELDSNNNYTNILKLDSNEINNQVNSNDLNPLTSGIGMTFMHELGHTPVGGGLHDPIGQGLSSDLYVGQVENRLNKIRSELGTDFGARMVYKNFRVNMSREDPKGQLYQAFSPISLGQLRNGQSPTTMFIQIIENDK